MPLGECEACYFFVAHLLLSMHAGLLRVDITTNQLHFHEEQNASILCSCPNLRNCNGLKFKFKTAIVFSLCKYLFIFLLAEVKSRKSVKRPWNDNEVRAIMKHFKIHILKGHLATKLECEQCKRAEHDVLRDRTLQNIRDFVRNRGVMLKRQRVL